LNTNEQTYISETTVNLLNKTTNEAVANALIENNSLCKTNNTISQLISFKGCEFGGDINIKNVKQSAMVTVNFSCLNAFRAEQDMAQSLLSKLTDELQHSVDAKSLNDMNTKAETAAQTAGFGGGAASAHTAVINNYNLKNVSTTNSNIQNVIANSVQANFTVKSISECLAQAAIQQNVDFSNCKAAGSLNMSELEQIAGISSVVNCVNKSGTVQAVMNQAANDMSVVIKSDTKVTSDSKITNTIKTAAESLGIGGGCPSCSSCPGCDASSGVTIWCLVILCICCCIVIAIRFRSIIF
jgi:hypothetical protein